MTPALPRTVDARALLGWMPREQAITYLREVCVFDPQLTEQQAEDFWLPYSQNVSAIQRSVTTPERLVMDPQEQAWAAEAMHFYKRTLRIPNVREIIKIDPYGLVAHQNYVVTEKAATYTQSLQNAADWYNEAVKPALPSPRNVPTFVGPNAMNIDLPHGEFTLAFNPAHSQYAVQENMRFVTAWEIQQFTRMILWAGYHRSYARMVNIAPDANVRSLLMVLVDVGTVDVFPGEPNGGLRAILCGPNPPLFGDFFDDRFCATVRLRKKRFQFQVRANCVPIDDLT
jgi:hypothetical protein